MHTHLFFENVSSDKLFFFLSRPFGGTSPASVSSALYIASVCVGVYVADERGTRYSTQSGIVVILE